MADTFVISGLRRKRGRLAGEIASAEVSLAKLRTALEAVDATLRLFEPRTNPDLIPAIRPSHHRCLFFRHGEQPRLCIDVLRDAGRPLSVRKIAAEVIAIKGLAAAEAPVQRRIVAQIGQCLQRMERGGTVRRVLEWPDVWWELVGD